MSFLSFEVIFRMNLVIDIGNTRVKTGIFNHGILVKNSVYESFNLLTLKRIFSEYKGIKNSILCSVKKYPASIRQFLSVNSCFIELTHTTPLPIKIGYKSPKTLGTDRIAAVCGAYNNYKKRTILVITAGTCITYNFMDSQSVFIGGSISPGLEMRFKSLQAFTGNLPLLSPDFDYQKLTGSSTEEAIKSGVQNGMLKEIEGIIREYQLSYPKIITIITGGNMAWLLKSLKIKIKGEPFLVLTGLNVILSHFLNQGNLASAN